jgi:hypothetical protein
VPWLKNTYNRLFLGFLISVLGVCFYIRPLQSPWDKFIAGDGLGYYSYLPARFIYHDTDYSFRWFNKVHDTNYIYSAFENPEDNLLVEYGDKKINKYYQGLSYIWLPFFALGHLCALLSGAPADGFSQPYQLAIGLASLVYLFIGLIFLRRLMLRLFGDPLVAVVIPAAFFYGTHLFSYAIKANSLSHAYSFSFIVLFLYYLVAFFQSEDRRWTYALYTFLFLVITICIRPLNGLVLVMVPAFIPRDFFRRPLFPGRFRAVDTIPLLLALGALYHQLHINYIQTGSLLSYTYTDERFYFERSKFLEGLFSYHIGLFVYVPLIFLSCFGILFLKPRIRIILPVFFFFMLYLYGAWWYWPILKRGMIDYYVIPAVCAGALLHAARGKSTRIWVLGAMFLTVIYYQWKNLQLTRGILDEYKTYKEVFWRDFFRWKRTNTYPVQPWTIKKQQSFTEGFEDPEHPGVRTRERVYKGNYALLLDPQNFISKICEYPYPDFFEEEGFRKIRFSFHGNFEEGTRSVHAFVQFYDKNGQLLLESPFYMNEESLPPGEWDYKEFGCELPEDVPLNKTTVDRIVFTIWNVEARTTVWIDEARVDFMLTDSSVETIKK